MQTLEALSQVLKQKFSDQLETITIQNLEITLEVKSRDLLEVANVLKEDPTLKFEMLMDICGVDYLEYGVSSWVTHKATLEGFSRGVEVQNPLEIEDQPAKKNRSRFAVVYHLLSVTHNHRLRLRTYAEGEPPRVPSVIAIWNSANWYEREAFDLFGIYFENHPDLRRLLTDYGFIGHPFRKDFPLIGTVEVHYSAAEQRVVYAPVSIQPRTLVPKTISKDSRYLEPENRS